MKPLATKPNSAQLSVLVVDDEPFVRDSLKLALRVSGYQVETAADGQAALELFAPGKFDLVVTDYAMPEMNGDVLAATLKARAPQQPIIMITAYGEALHSRGQALSRVDYLLSKPFSIESLRQAIARLVPRAQSTCGNRAAVSV